MTNVKKSKAYSFFSKFLKQVCIFLKTNLQETRRKLWSCLTRSLCCMVRDDKSTHISCL